jgi:uncharacterized Zn finger protein (UPF0148 family)
LPTQESKELQSMADLLKKGATLTDLSCPACASPLFKLRSDEIWCVKCQKRVVIVKEGQTAEEATRPVLLASLEATLLTKIQAIEKKLKTEPTLAELERLTNTLVSLLENLEKIKKMKH